MKQLENMNLTLHDLSIGESLQSPISAQDIIRRDTWMILHTRELFSLAKEALTTRQERSKAALVCDECATTGSHSTENCPFPARHIPLFPEA